MGLLLDAVRKADALKKGSAPCKPGDCPSCPFPPCSQEQKKKNTNQ